MVIACEHCNTRFQLDDARVPDTGVRVRCSRCKHAFFVAPPGGAEEALHAAAADAAAAEAPSPPPPTEDLPPSMGSADGEPDAELEEDWQFNIPESGGSDAPAAEDASSPAPPPAQPLLSDSTPLAAPRTEEAPPSLPEAQPHETREHSFEPQPGDDDLRDQLFGDADAGEVPDDSGAETGAAEDQLFGSSDGELGADDQELASSAPETPAAEVEPEPGESLADLGSPEDWDFIGDGPVSAPEPVAAPAASASVSDESAAVPAQQSASPEPDLAVDRRASAPRWMVWVDAAGWLACAVFLVVGVAGAWNGSLEPSLRTAAAAELGPLRLEDLRAAVVENVHAGSVWVFRGTLVNPQADAARADAIPRLALLDAEGEVVGEAWFGRSASAEALRERAPAEVAPRSRAASRDLARRNLASGEQIELTAIVERLPDTAVAWRVEAAAVPPRSTGPRSSTPPSLPSSRE